MSAPNPQDEARHTPDDTELWNESYYLDWFAEDLSLGGYVRIGFYPNLDRVWYWACLVGPDRPLVTVIEHDIPMPRSASSLEVRSEGLWADHVVETPNEHMSINLEAFGLQLDDPAEVYHPEPRGSRVAFGFELDFHTDRAAYLWPPVTPRYEIPCRVEGFVQVGDERIEVDGWGQRDHSWGAARDWWTNQWSWTAGRLSDGTRWHSAGGFFPDADWGVAYRLDPDSTEFAEGDTVVLDVTEGRERLPTRTGTKIVDLDLEFEPVAFSPVLLVHPDGRAARFPRAMARVTTSDGREGGGWIEWNQPPTGTKLPERT
ncbi:DUF7064 domain-containing protein [Dermatobacter hominis]|uniref:DUF7064 domain-containing protein n=1 Tax=Dermatobacter hominis TaxID=2884263 RepID=UPI001D0FC5F2|nr:hypothetical protein [Dermatobacter hominis]UDY37912.1 hypothetical protein LH044_10290 [Dermatobacter hominis]